MMTELETPPAEPEARSLAGGRTPPRAPWPEGHPEPVLAYCLVAALFGLGMLAASAAIALIAIGLGGPGWGAAGGAGGLLGLGGFVLGSLGLRTPARA